MRPGIAVVALLAGASLVRAEAVEVTGTVCRTNRVVDRLIVLDATDARRLVEVGPETRVSNAGAHWEAADLRPGDRVRLLAERDAAGVLHPLALDVQVPVAGAIVGALLGTRPRVIGRFAVREAQTEYFSLRLPGGDFIRVDSKLAYGPEGRMRASRFRSGDLLELDGEWVRDGELAASHIAILTDEEPLACQPAGGEQDTPALAERRAAEERFLDGFDPEVAGGGEAAAEEEP